MQGLAQRRQERKAFDTDKNILKTDIVWDVLGFALWREAPHTDSYRDWSKLKVLRALRLCAKIKVAKGRFWRLH